MTGLTTCTRYCATRNPIGYIFGKLLFFITIDFIASIPLLIAQSKGKQMVVYRQDMVNVSETRSVYVLFLCFFFSWAVTSICRLQSVSCVVSCRVIRIDYMGNKSYRFVKSSFLYSLH